MTPELGHFALVLALLVAIAQGTVPFIGAARGDHRLMGVAPAAAGAQLGLVAIAFASLMYAYIVSDFTVLIVAENSHSAKPLLYKITGVWGNHEGSMLLWLLILAVFGSMVGLFGTNLPPTLRARVLSVQAWIAIGFLAFTIFTSNPFERLFPPPANGQGLNPILQDPGLAFHPPMLYMGYVGFSMAFSFAIAALIEGKVDAAWARWVRPWTLIAWVFLTCGIGLGSWWAYYELGWGGWWFWDPVENVSFMPWLLGTALLHSALVVEKRDALKVWTILLAILTFALSLIGTFIVRSGLLTSVHSFATDPTRGVFILGLLGIAIGGGLILFALRAPGLKPGGLFQPISREGALVLNNLLLAAACATVFIGTLYPLFLEAVSGEKVTVGPPFFDATFVPIMAPLVAAMAIGPLLPWKRGDLGGVLSRLKLAALLGVVAFALALALVEGGAILAAFGVGLGAWLLAGTLIHFAERVRLFRAPWKETLQRAAGLPRSAYGMTVAHCGIAVAMIGMVAATAWQEESVLAMRQGQSTELAGYTYRLNGVRQAEGPNYTATRADFTVFRGDRRIAHLEPERRAYPVEGMPTTEAAIHSTGLADLHAVIGEQGSSGAWTTRLYHKPLIPWIWAGVLLMAAGGVLSLSDRRLRVGAPRAARRAAKLARAKA